jgi:hypothetical protein
VMRAHKLAQQTFVTLRRFATSITVLVVGRLACKCHASQHHQPENARL